MFFGVLCVLLDVLGVFLAYLVFSQQISINENFGVVGVFCRIWCFFGVLCVLLGVLGVFWHIWCFACMLFVWRRYLVFCLAYLVFGLVYLAYLVYFGVLGLLFGVFGF